MVLKLSESHSGVTSRTSQTRGSKQIYPGGSKRLPSRRSRRSFAKILHSMFCGRLSFFFREMVLTELKGTRTHFITSLHVWLSWGRISSMASRMTGTMHIREAGHHKHTVAWLISFFSSCFCGHWPIIHWWICLLNKLWKWCCIHQWMIRQCQQDKYQQNLLCFKHWKQLRLRANCCIMSSTLWRSRTLYGLRRSSLLACYAARSTSSLSPRINFLICPGCQLLRMIGRTSVMCSSSLCFKLGTCFLLSWWFVC